MERDHYAELEEIFLAGVRRVDPRQMILDRLTLRGGALELSAGDSPIQVELSRFERIVLLGVGKAAAKMAAGVRDLLGDRLEGGIIVVKDAHEEELGPIGSVVAGHPVPDSASVEAARAVASLAEEADETTLIVGVTSGGGSALLCYPYERGELRISLEEKGEVTQALLSSGATIQEVNCVRKHLSGIKGGRLVEVAYPATVVNLVLSDVVGDELDAVASGLTVPDGTTFADALHIIDRYAISDRIPAAALRILEAGARGEIPDTPKPGDRGFERVTNLVLGSNAQALEAAAAKARNLGYETVVLSSQITGEAREVAHVYLGIARDLRKRGMLARRPACIIGGGETTVTLQGPGKGGRNQEMALAVLLDMERRSADTDGVYFLSAGTDGNDGPTDAAGAFASREVLEQAMAAGLSAEDYLRRSDSYHYFDSIGRLLKTGPTFTNVCDLQVVLVP